MLDLNKPYVLKYRPKPKPRPLEVLQMMKPHSRQKYVPPPPPVPIEVEAAPVQGNPGDNPDSEPEFLEPETPGLPSLMDILSAEAGDDDDDDVLIGLDQLEPEPSNLEKRRKTS